MYQLAARDVQLQPPERKAQKMPESNKHDYQRVYKDRRRKSDLIPLTLPDHQAHLSDAFFPFFFVFARTLASSHSAMPVLRYLKEVYAVLLLNHHPGRHPSTTSKVYAGP